MSVPKDPTKPLEKIEPKENKHKGDLEERSFKSIGAAIIDTAISGGIGMGLILVGLYATDGVSVRNGQATNLEALLTLGGFTLIYSIYSGVIAASYYTIKNIIKR